VHEVFRVFYDRLVDDEDRTWLYKLTRALAKDHFKENYDTLFDHLAQPNQPVNDMTAEDCSHSVDVVCFMRRISMRLSTPETAFATMIVILIQSTLTTPSRLGVNRP